MNRYLILVLLLVAIAGTLVNGGPNPQFAPPPFAPPQFGPPQFGPIFGGGAQGMPCVLGWQLTYSDANGSTVCSCKREKPVLWLIPVWRMDCVTTPASTTTTSTTTV